LSALKKTSVAIMIMFVCLILAIVIGEARKDIYENPSAHQETVLSKLNEMTTWGTITNTVEENVSAPSSYNSVSDNDSDSGLSKGGIIILIIVIICVLKGLSNKK